ncbi:hypothetical protein Tco_1239407 [Tanacetum coccineum]
MKIAGCYNTTTQTRFKSVSKYSNDLLLARGNTLRSDEDRLKLDELLALCTTLQNRVLDLEKTKTTQHNEITSLKRRVKKLEKKDSLGEDASKQGRIDAIDADEEITLVSVHDVNVSVGEEDKGKGMLIELVKPMNKKYLIRLDEETALNLQAEFDEEERLAREKAKKEEEANIALIETWDDIQAKIINWLKECKHENKKTKRAEEKRNNPPTKSQQRKIMCTYLKSIEGYKLKDLKLKEFDSIQEMFDRVFKRLMEIIPDEEEVAIDSIPLAVKSPSIVGWKIYKKGRKNYYQIMRADGKYQMYMIFSQMLKSFDKEDLEDLYKLVKAKYESTRLGFVVMG